MTLLIGITLLTAYAIGITYAYNERNEQLLIIKSRLATEINSAKNWRTRCFSMAQKLDEQRAGFNDEIHKLEKENKQLKDTNVRMFERQKRLIP